ncbi:MAG: hypothetical protein RL011_504, partial [Pseudomonadota bacterium]
MDAQGYLVAVLSRWLGRWFVLEKELLGTSNQDR